MVLAEITKPKTSVKGHVILSFLVDVPCGFP